MARIFSIIAAISALMVFLAAIGTYWLADIKIKNSAVALISAKSQGLATSLSIQLDTLQQSVNGVARSPDVIAALNSTDPVTLNSIARKSQPLIPGALRVRLLPPNTNEPDLSVSPYMGFGDLEMVHSTLKSKQKAVIQGESEQRHLALTSPVNMNDRVIGVVLVSFNPDLLYKTVANAGISDGYIEIKQDQAIVTTAGNPGDKAGNPASITLDNARWTINFWAQQAPDLDEFILLATITIMPALLIILAFFISYRKLTELLQQDQSVILRAVKDTLTNKNLGNYPMQLDEMRPIIANMMQFRRAYQDQETPPPPTKVVEATAYDDGYDIQFLEEKPSRITRKITSLKLGKKSIAAPEPTPAPTNNFSYANIFRSYDIRGIVGQDLDQEIVTKIGQAIASEAKELGINSIVVGRDGRLSSLELSTALISGICNAGCNVEDLGLIPTPLLYFVSYHKEGRSGIMITGSHNPAEYNGLKIVLNNETLAETRIQNLRTRIEANDYHLDLSGTCTPGNDYIHEYIGMIIEDIKINRPIKVVIDCGNGAASILAPTLFKALGCEIIELYCDIDGNFPNHHPDPSKPENLADLVTAVKQAEADIGIAFDGDGDRLGVVDSAGNIIWPDRQMIVFARHILNRKPGGKVLFDVKCSRQLEYHIRKFGGQPIMWKTGHSLLKAKLKETAAVLAGEMSGHLFFNDRWFGFDDACYAAARLIEIIAADPRSSAEIFAEYPDTINTPELTIPLAEGENIEFVKQMFQHADFNDGNIISIDGLRVEFADGWGLVRASNTTPSLVLRFEADNQTALKRIQRKFKFLMLQIKPDLNLPF